MENKIKEYFKEKGIDKHHSGNWDYDSLLELIEEFNKLNNITDQDLIAACKYGYDYHKTSQFPETEFEDMAINNFKQVLQSKEYDKLLGNLKSPKDTERKEIESGQRLTIEVGAVEFNADGNTIWVQSKLGGTTMRIKCTGKINVERCVDSALSHCDIMTEGDIKFCVSSDVE